MIFGFLDSLSERRRVDKAYEMRNLVEGALSDRGEVIDKPMVDSGEREEIVAPHVAITYMLIGFEPAKHNETDESMPDLSQGRRDMVVYRESMFLTIAGAASSLKSREVHFVDQDLEMFDGYGCETAEDVEVERGVSLSGSVRHSYKKDKVALAQTIADIAEPIAGLGFAEAREYMANIRGAVRRDRPDLHGLVEAAKFLKEKRSAGPGIGDGNNRSGRFLYCSDFLLE